MRQQSFHDVLKDSMHCRGTRTQNLHLIQCFLGPEEIPPQIGDQAIQLFLYILSAHQVDSTFCPPWDGKMSTGDGHSHCQGEKRRVLHYSTPYGQDCLPTDLVG